ncbi:unnamed protein product [Knipowitschia caucasica]|uniref:Protein SSUH2 homolog n=1 Tax=Knipowitschia caucasica TaxID=637954 RepID=A0AAV2MIF1_KNICA
MTAAYPSAPPSGMFGSVPGYEGIGGGGFLPPPVPLEPLPPPQPGPAPDDWTIPSLSEDEAQEAFKSFASGHCCWSSAPAKDGVITGIQAYNTYRYRLETYTESRSTEWAQKPHEGEAADFYTQPAPRPWEVVATPPSNFTNQKQEIRVPFTASVKDCSECRASGTKPCETCKGDGKKNCWVCSGAGTRDGQNCSRCNGTGSERCDSCDGRGTSDCDVCKGKRRMLAYIKLTVEWKNQCEDHVVHQESGLNSEDLKSVHGKQLFTNSAFMLYPLMGFPNAAISEASARMIQDHQTKYSQNGRILQQRQTVELIPISKVSYKWKGDTHNFYVYGNERGVSADYPATCCCAVM